jgi:site-specific DNA-methyltransferase (adenine-specific)
MASSRRVAPSSERHRPVIVLGDALDHYALWPRPTVIVSDGAYGINGFPGDPPTHEGLVEWYRPHVEAWTKRSTPATTLWFWGTEIGWATVHPLLLQNEWEYRSCHVWDKGIAHAAGNTNTKTLRKFPVVTEVCVQYVRDVRFDISGSKLSMKAWLRHEWERSGLPLYLTNEACGVKNAATRKYFTQCHLWYYPPIEAFEQFVAYANKHGRPEGHPYFSIDGERSLTGQEWAKLRAKFSCDLGITNVWSEPAVRGSERYKEEYRCIHGNQKPLKLLDRIIRASSDPGDVVWEPFGGLCSAAVAAYRAERQCFSAEVLQNFYALACHRLEDEYAQSAAADPSAA